MSGHYIMEKRHRIRVQPDYRLTLEENIFKFQSLKMLHEQVSIAIDGIIWERRMARLRALESVNGPHSKVEFIFHVYMQLQAAMKDGDVDSFILALEDHCSAVGLCLSDILKMQGPSGNSLLHIAAGIVKPDILQALLDVTTDKYPTFTLNDLGDNPLHIAVRAGRIQAAKLLLNCNIYVDMQNGAGNMALHEAVMKHDEEMIRLLLEKGSILHRKNNENKCPLYLAVETGKSKVVQLLLGKMHGNENLESEILGLSPVHGAVKHKRLDMLRIIFKQKKELFDIREAGSTPLHQAAYENYIEGVRFLVKEFIWSTYATDEEGYFPIHLACKMGHLETIKELIQHWPDPEELLTKDNRQNILHIAAKYGRASVVKYMLGDSKFEKMINAKDKDGNTPLHLATWRWQPEVLLPLSRDSRVNLQLVNNDNLTALDIVDKQRKIDAPLPESITEMILLSAGAHRSKDKAISRTEGPGLVRDLELDRLKYEVNTRMVVATLVATITFAAGFSVPGGYNNSEPDVGIATLLNKPMYNVFVICNTVAMYSSIVSVVILLWTQISDSVAMVYALKKARLLLLIALSTMAVAFMAGVYVTTSKRHYIAIVALIIGTIVLSVILSLYVALFVLLGYKSRLIRLVADYIIRAGLLISRSATS